MKIEREVLVLRTRVLGAEHEETLRSAVNLVVSLWQRGLRTEAEQIYREALAVAQRTLGPAHEYTQCVLQKLRNCGLIAL